MWDIDYICLNNDNFSGYMKGCFSHISISYDNLHYKKRWNPVSMEEEDAYYVLCPRCGRVTIIDDRIIPEEIKSSVKNRKVLSMK